MAMFIGGIGAVPARGAEPIPQADSILAAHVLELYRWAEYDSVLAAAPALAENAGLPARLRAQLRLSLGVAEYSEGRVAASAGDFLSAHELDSAQVLDPLYVEKNAVDHYRFTLASEAGLRAWRAAEAGRASRELAHRGRRASVLAWTGLGAGILGLAAAAYEFDRGEQAYQDLVQAARVTGDPSRYSSKQAEVRKADRLTLAAGAVGLGGLVAGGLMWLEARWIRKGSAAPTLYAAPGAANLKVAWSI